MPHLSRSELAAYAACAVIVAVLGWRALPHDAGAPAPGSERASSGGPTVVAAPSERSALVHVVGAVRRPGVYRLAVGQRVKDAIRRAGGPTARADTQAINLAAKLADAQQIVVPRKVQANGAAAGTAAEAAQGTVPGPAAAPVNLNTATLEQLDTLDGVGPTTAQKILQYRTEHGGFSSVDDLGQIPGIGPKRLESLRAQVQL